VDKPAGPTGRLCTTGGQLAVTGEVVPRNSQSGPTYPQGHPQGHPQPVCTES